MNAVEKRAVLGDRIQIILSGFYYYSIGSEKYDKYSVKDVVQITKQDGELFEFNFLAYKLCILREIDAMRGIAYLRTYKIEIDKQDYPKNKLVHIDDLDIAFVISSEAVAPVIVCTFVKKFMKQIHFPPPEKIADANATQITNFNKQYLDILFAAFA